MTNKTINAFLGATICSITIFFGLNGATWGNWNLVIVCILSFPVGCLIMYVNMADNPFNLKNEKPKVGSESQ